VFYFLIKKKEKKIKKEKKSLNAKKLDKANILKG